MRIRQTGADGASGHARWIAHRHPGSLKRLRRRLTEERFVFAGEPSELEESVQRRYVGHRQWGSRSAPQRATNLMQLPELQVSLRTRRADMVEGVSQASLADAGAVGQLRNRNGFSDVAAKE